MRSVGGVGEDNSEGITLSDAERTGIEGEVACGQFDSLSRVGNGVAAVVRLFVAAAGYDEC